jgi:hypothetical protein
MPIVNHLLAGARLVRRAVPTSVTARNAHRNTGARIHFAANHSGIAQDAAIGVPISNPIRGARVRELHDGATQARVEIAEGSVDLTSRIELEFLAQNSRR